MSEKAGKRFTGAAAAWAVLHFLTGVRAFFESWYNTYTGLSWALLGIWLLGLLAVDVWMYFSGGPEPLRSLKWYWGFSAGLYGVMLLAILLDWPSCPDWIALIFVISTFLTPFHQLTAFLWLLLQGLAGLGGRALADGQCAAGMLFCLAHFAYTARLLRRARKKGAPPYGPLEPGTGAME